MENSPMMSFVRSAPLARVVLVADKADPDRVVVDKADPDRVVVDKVDLDKVDLDKADLDKVDLDKADLDKVVADLADPADLDRAPVVRAVRPRRSHPHSHDPSRAWAQRPKWRCALIPTPPLREP
jgi:hypothetical protein